MKKTFSFSAPLAAALLLSSALGAQAQAAPSNMNGALPEPLGAISDRPTQLKIRFPESILKNKTDENPFEVKCSPAVEGFASWADNNTVFTYNFKAKDENSNANLAGGTLCEVKQIAPLTSASNKLWAAGTIQYQVSINGPNVSDVYAGEGFKGTLRETDPVMLVLFDGPINKTKFFAEGQASLSYTSSNAPAEKMKLSSLPADKQKEIFELYKSTRYFDTKFEDGNWVLATVAQSLIPGATLRLTVNGQESALNPTVKNVEAYAQDLSVRSQFEAKVECANPSARAGACLPQSPVSVVLNGQTKWTDIKEAYIEYVPYRSADKKRVRSYPEIVRNEAPGFFTSLYELLENYFPFLAKYNDTVVDRVSFNVSIEPETNAKVILPKDLKDIDGRSLSNVLSEFYLRIASMREVLQVPQELAFFEKNVPNLYLPVGVVNLNQKLVIRKSGTDPKVWAPTQDPKEMIRIIRAYQTRPDYRETPQYTSPLETLGIASTVVDQQLSGTKNRPNFLQFPFVTEPGQTPGGFYAIEISSPTYEEGRSDKSENRFYNPRYVLAQVTDLAVHLKKGQTNSLAWVTRLSTGKPVGGAQVQILNCLGEPMKSMTTDASGLASFENQTWATDCNTGDEQRYSQFFQPSEYFVSVQVAGDVSLTHSSWNSSSNVYSAPGIEYFYNDISENKPYFHSVIGVNLVKPGQKVPVTLYAQIPTATGFREVPEADLPKAARIVSYEDSDLYYEFPLTWNGGSANLTWQVPASESARLGSYMIEVVNPNDGGTTTLSSGDIEVAEFKIPLMSGLIAFPNGNLVKPDSIPVNAVIRYANGVGAKEVKTDVSYFFEPTAVSSPELKEFSFGSGALRINDEAMKTPDEDLPNSSRPVTIADLQTGADGSLTRDFAKEMTAQGRTIAEALKSSQRPQKLIVRVRYQDQMGEFQTLSQAKDIYNSEDYAGTRIVSGNRADAKLMAATIDPSGKNITKIDGMDLRVVRVDTKVIGEELFGGLIKNTLERQVQPTRWKAACSLQEKVITCSVGSLKEGSYAFEATSKAAKQVSYTLFKVDAEGRVYGENDYYGFGDGDDDKQLPLALNKKAYRDGEKAVVSFSAPFKTCSTLVTIERSDVMSATVVPTACEKGFVEVPVSSTSAPNAYVSVMTVTGRAASKNLKVGEMDLGRPTYKLGYANIKVNWSNFKNQVSVKTDKPKYEPGETVKVEVQVKPEQGTLKNAKVTLVVLEEKILELKNNDTYKILDAVMQLRRLNVGTVTPLERIETATTENAELSKAADRKGGDEGGDGSSKSEFKRKLFDGLVSYQTDVPVVNGVANLSFVANDSLTKFKIFAIATDSSAKFGTGEVSYLSEKDTQSFSNIPNIAHTGDQFNPTVTIQNNTAKATTYKVEVRAVTRDSSGKIIGDKTMTKTVSIDKSTSKAIDTGSFEIGEDAASVSYVINIYDENGNLVDSMEPAAQTVLASVPLAIHDSFIVQAEKGSASQTLTKEATALPGKGEIRVSVTGSLVTTALRQIAGRMERDAFCDFFVESKFNKAFLMSSAKNPQPLKDLLETFMAQTDGAGLLKYYPQAQRGSIELTAHVILTLQTEAWAMALVPANLSAKWQAAVMEVLTKSINPVYVGQSPMSWIRAQTRMGRAAYAFDDQVLKDAAAGFLDTVKAELAQNPQVYGQPVEKWSNRQTLDLWLLQIAVSHPDAQASDLSNKILIPRLVYNGSAAQLQGQPLYNSYYSDETMETADLLAGLATLQGDKNQARALAVGLINANVKSWYGNSTMLSVATALKTFGRNYEKDVVTGTTTINVPEVQVAKSVNWTDSQALDMVSAWTVPTATVQLTHSGAGEPWVSIQGLSAVPLTAPRNQGLSIEKTIKNITRDSGFQAGDLIEVTLNIQTTGSLSHIALQDPIPAGANILADAFGAFTNGQKSYSGYKLYFEEISPGLSTVKYQYQLNNPGQFKMPPTRAEGLFMPSIFGETPNDVMIVK